MNTANRSFEVYQEFRTNAQTLGDVYDSFKDIQNYVESAKILTELLFSEFYADLAESNLNNKYEINLTDFKSQNVTKRAAQVEAGLPILQVVNMLTSSLSCMRTDRQTPLLTNRVDVTFPGSLHRRRRLI